MHLSLETLINCEFWQKSKILLSYLVQGSAKFSVEDQIEYFRP